MKVMKIELLDGCTSRDLFIDDEYIEDCSVKKIDDSLRKIIDDLELYQKRELLVDLIEQFGELKDCYVCEECGDTCCTYLKEL